MLGIVVSRADSASEHVGEHLLDLAEWRETTDERRSEAAGGGAVYRLDDAELRTVDALHLETTDVAEAFDDPDLIAFASRHAGDTGPLLTAHHTGNFGPAEHGGRDGTLARTCPSAHRRVVRSLAAHAPEGYDVGTECTHHGPSDVGAPSMFVELGSAEAEWADPEAARAVAAAILDLRGVAPDAPPENGVRRHLVGFGGGHYAPRFERVIRETDWAVGHVAADWCLDAMGDPSERVDVLRQAFDRSAADYALLSGDRPGLAATVESLGFRVVSETWVRETSGVPLSLVERLEDAVAPVEDGLRFGDAAAGYDGEFAIRSVSTGLLAEARGIDPEAARRAVASTTLAYGTEQRGSQVVGPIAVRGDSDAAAAIDALADVLRHKYEEVVRDGGELIARERAFDPALARDAGVPEGPKFGRLSGGESVEVDGRTVEPSAVTRERERRFNC